MSSFDISHYRVPGCDAVYYIPQFITVHEDEESYLIRKIKEMPQHMWKQLGNRRLQVWGGEVLTNGLLLAKPLPPFVDDFPDLMSRLRSMGVFDSSPHGSPNHIILNEYLPNQGIMPHEDGPTYHPVVATISLGSHTVFHYYRYAQELSAADNTMPLTSNGKGRAINPTPVISVLLERRSLVITMRNMYTDCLHGIEEKVDDHFNEGSIASGNGLANDKLLRDPDILTKLAEGRPLPRGIRYSLTCRDIGRVATLKSFVNC
ncbi:hypothetical protein AMATHDRAFT_145694 [Amanita thiersii Skay4041]|uniref:Fe2OG dioxygenase domain-containing protein n=1 Tax=Amanita thiersii Skay4041 TaxID=703135 RepID=A0A2A9NHX3_9AGAR|nr:hypothetical protein AMATHDRAFT_145694 [Amanita thiersii Skay4041]